MMLIRLGRAIARMSVGIALVSTAMGLGWVPGAAAQPVATVSERVGLAQPAATPSRALLDRYCVTCHNERLLERGTVPVAFEDLDTENVGVHAAVWEKVVRKLRAGQMPPAGRPRPDTASVDAFLTTLEGALDHAAATVPTPGRVATRRLNRVEYVNAIQDLLALEVNATELLPSDTAGFGFDNNADVLSMTPALLARYMAAATKISRAAVGNPDIRPTREAYWLGSEVQNARMNEEMPFETHGGLSARHIFPLDGEYVFAVRMKSNTQSGVRGIAEDDHEIQLRVDHALVKRWNIGGKFPGPDPGTLVPIAADDLEGQQLHYYRMTADEALDVRVPVMAGQRLVTVSFTDSDPTPLDGAYGNPGINQLLISGPFNGTVPDNTASRRRIFTCRPSGAHDEEECAREIITTLARRAYRRPVQDRDLEPLLAFYQQGRRDRDFDAGIERALEALLSMPEFVLRLERLPDDAAPGQSFRLTDLELASRLSFFLWRSIPDDALLEVATAGRLSDPAVLADQVRRMLADRRATRFLNDFVGQWLRARNIQGQEPLFAGFNDSLRKAMLRETELFFESQVREDRPIPELLRADYTYLNEQLARHYGVDDVHGSRFRRVTWGDDRRHGLLGHASLLTVTSYANRTSVVLRGKWVLEALLGAPPPPPPPNVPPLEENEAGEAPTSLRERMEQHRANPVCASCHAQMDPLGFALQHFDAVGRWRENDSGAPINATIEWNGQTIDDSPRAFREALLGQGSEFVRTVTEKLLTYALSRGLTHHDAPTVRQFVRDLAQNDDRWSSLVLGIVTSEPFQMHQAPGADTTAPGTLVGLGQ